MEQYFNELFVEVKARLYYVVSIYHNIQRPFSMKLMDYLFLIFVNVQTIKFLIESYKNIIP